MLHSRVLQDNWPCCSDPGVNKTYRRTKKQSDKSMKFPDDDDSQNYRASSHPEQNDGGGMKRGVKTFDYYSFWKM